MTASTGNRRDFRQGQAGYRRCRMRAKCAEARRCGTKCRVTQVNGMGAGVRMQMQMPVGAVLLLAAAACCCCCSALFFFFFGRVGLRAAKNRGGGVLDSCCGRAAGAERGSGRGQQAETGACLRACLRACWRCKSGMEVDRKNSTKLGTGNGTRNQERRDGERAEEVGQNKDTRAINPSPLLLWMIERV